MPKQCLELCESIMENVAIRFEYHSCGPDMRICSMCDAEIEDTYVNDKYKLDNFPHEEDCPYVLAKKILGYDDEEDKNTT